MKIMSVFGTRPEAIKMCPLVKEIEKQHDMESIVCLSGQHREMLIPILELFEIKVNHNLDIMRPKQTLTTITADILTRIEDVLIKERPEIVLVHGDTTTSFVAALAAFYQKIPVGHVEAGLRSGDKFSPYPEEMNRTLTTRIAELHFAPTENNKSNLLKEGITEGITVTGNTVMDAFHTTLKENYEFQNELLKTKDLTKGRWILLTAHRRENLGKPLEQICEAVKQIVKNNKDVNVVYPVHPNPAVRETVENILKNQERVYLTEPFDVQDMHNLMRRSYLVLTDSGGLQEEAPSCGVPVLVLRTETERPEAVQAGTVRIIGVETEDIVRETEVLLHNKTAYEQMAMAVNPYGDGKASCYIVEALRKWGQETLG
ncbi:non-hydrolyzing UDP-N-acetylglucosamine 2-epimerase [Kineothrix sp. MB12-C1]|uniref:non-hydrolyzing UDP-N-acetylglucosamine 2-epimerase n=1 Tax=Kineothrix sp. MB12-C1 TaxID=3070215 RepID=UPI0027D34271|nr:UDP-N-acetylglucosamine 2-epimerase (non-hydrolyzing) [Kineothrix sp. MB12-C1]WMC93730.1 UDP-N-acetylglucosamine 2-epimerase (non-hydrolyzing) [Kineothrix sp. MB12-C1]